MRSRSDSSSEPRNSRCLADRQLADLVDVLAADGDRERRRPQARAVARGARHLAHVALDLLARRGRSRTRCGGAPATAPRPRTAWCTSAAGRSGCGTTPCTCVLAGAVEHDLLVVLLQLLPRRVDGEAVLVGDRLEHPLEVVAPEARPRRDRAVADRQVVVGDDQLGVDLEARARARRSARTRRTAS